MLFFSRIAKSFAICSISDIKKAYSLSYALMTVFFDFFVVVSFFVGFAKAIELIATKDATNFNIFDFFIFLPLSTVWLLRLLRFFNNIFYWKCHRPVLTFSFRLTMMFLTSFSSSFVEAVNVLASLLKVRYLSSGVFANNP